MEGFKKKLMGRQLLILSGLLLTCSALLISRHYEKVSAAPLHRILSMAFSSDLL